MKLALNSLLCLLLAFSTCFAQTNKTNTKAETEYVDNEDSEDEYTQAESHETTNSQEEYAEEKTPTLQPTERERPIIQSVEYPNQCYTKKMCCKRPCLSTRGDFGVNITGEYLYWKPSVGENDYAIDTTVTGTTAGEKSYAIDFKYDSGFRVGLGSYLPCSCWQLNGYYTNIHCKGSDSCSGILYPNFFSQFTGTIVTYATDASARFGMHYQAADLIFGHETRLGKSFLFTPYFGIKGVRIRQNFNYDYSGGNVSTGSTYYITLHNRCMGIGLQGGIFSQWVWKSGFRFLSRASGALLSSSFKTRHIQFDLVESCNVKKKIHRYSPNLNLMAALSWGTQFNSTVYFGLSAGFESQYWFRQNQTIFFVNDSYPVNIRTSDDLSMQGLTASVYLNF